MNGSIDQFLSAVIDLLNSNAIDICTVCFGCAFLAAAAHFISWRMAMITCLCLGLFFSTTSTVASLY